MDESILLANLVMLGCLSLERIFKAFQCDMHSIRSIEFSSLCCAAELQRQPTPPNSAVASPTGISPTPSATYEAPPREERFRRGPITLQDLIDNPGPIETRRFS